MKVKLLSVAKRELRDAFDWYERQSPGVGRGFLAEFDQVVNRIRHYPESCAVAENGMRRALFNRFPYGLWYDIEGDTVMVDAISHLHRHPHYWVGRAPTPDP